MGIEHHQQHRSPAPPTHHNPELPFERILRQRLLEHSTLSLTGHSSTTASREYPVMIKSVLRLARLHLLASRAPSFPAIPGRWANDPLDIVATISVMPLRVMRFQHPVAQVAEDFDHIGAHIATVLYQQDRRGGIGRAAFRFRCASRVLPRTARRYIVTIVPGPLAVDLDVPARLSDEAVDLAHAEAGPLPALLVVKTGSNTRSRTSGDIPLPASPTATRTSSPATSPSWCWQYFSSRMEFTVTP